MSLRVTLLGTGTSSGIPLLGCRCAVCRSKDPRNRRTRCSAWLCWDGASVLVDTSPDLRQQALAEGMESVDAVLYTHAHADHLHGFDELRTFSQLRGRAIPCFGSEATLATVRHRFDYAFTEVQVGGGVPQVELRPVRAAFELYGRKITPVPLLHGRLEVTGYRVGAFAYLTDCGAIPESSYPLLQDLDVLVLDALRYRPHSTHFTLSEAVEAASRIGARRTWFVHMSHEVDHGDLKLKLPPTMELAHDGLRIELD